MEHRIVARVFLAAFLVAASSSALAQESVRITLPSVVTFNASTTGTATGTPSPTTVTYDNAILQAGRVLRISVRADSNRFTGPDGPSFRANLVSWTVSNVSGGTGSAGTLSNGGYTQVFQSNLLTAAGGFDINWALASVAGVSRAGTHTLTLRWRIESVFP